MVEKKRVAPCLESTPTLSASTDMLESFYELDVHSALERDLAWGSCQARLTDLVGTETMIPCNIQIDYYSRDSKRSKCAIFLGPLFNRAAAEQKGLDTTPGMVGHPGAEKPILAAELVACSSTLSGSETERLRPCQNPGGIEEPSGDSLPGRQMRDGPFCTVYHH